MRLSLLGISVSLLGIAIILTSTDSEATFGLALSGVGFVLSFASCFFNEAGKVQRFLK